MRLFFALWPSEQERAAALEQMKSLRLGVKARWVQPDNLHVTLAFLGEVDNGRLLEVLKIGASCEAQPFEFSLAKLEYWRKPQVLCLTCPNPPLALSQLAVDLAQKLRTSGFDLESRPYRPHLTLARKALPLGGNTPMTAPLRWQADRFVLVESSTGSRGPLYQVLQTWPLSVEP